jgi:hypothetical protein
LTHFFSIIMRPATNPAATLSCYLSCYRFTPRALPTT